MLTESLKKEISETLFLSDSFIQEKINTSVSLKPNINLFKYLKLDNIVISKLAHFYSSGDKIRVKVFNNHDLSRIQSFLIKESAALGGYSVILDNSDQYNPELILEWPPLTQERINKAIAGCKKIETELNEILRLKRQKCKTDFTKHLSKEEQLKIENFLDIVTKKEKQKISDHIKKVINTL